MSAAASVPDRIDIVLVPFDGSEFSERALPVAARLGLQLNAEVHLLSVVKEEAAAAVLPVFGSVAAAIVGHSPSPVLVVPR